MQISIIVAMAENRVIGRAGGLPWRIPGDLRRFKEVTMGKPIVMGRRTYQSIGRPLPDRPNIVITRDETFQAEGLHVVHGFDQALEKAAQLVNDGEVIIIGGAEIYRMALESASRLYLTEVHENAEGDTHFPNFDRSRWQEISRDDHPNADGDAPGHSFIVLERIDGDGY